MWWQSIISGLVGGILALAGALLVERLRDASTARTELRNATSAYLGAASTIVALLHGTPPATKPGWFQQWQKERHPDRVWEAEQRAVTKTFGDSPRLLMLSVATAYGSLLLLDLSDELRTAVDATQAYIVELSDHRSPEAIGKWPAIHAELIEQTRVQLASTAWWQRASGRG